MCTALSCTSTGIPTTLPNLGEPDPVTGLASGRDHEDGRGWLLLPKSGWRRVDTLRVRRLFG